MQERYERHHHVVYSSDALAAAVQLSSRYITDRFLPDKVRMGKEAGQGTEPTSAAWLHWAWLFCRVPWKCAPLNAFSAVLACR